MLANPLAKLVKPRFPTAAVGIEGGNAALVQVERRRRDKITLRRAAIVALPDALVRPSFDEHNLADTGELAEVLADLATDAGLGRQRRWSVALPEAATRTVILTLESAPASRAELEDILRWKTERGFGVPLEELRVSRERLSPDAQGRARYLVTAIHQSVLAEYENVFAALGWRAGLILPRHMGEARWLTRSSARGGDALLISSHADGFTALMIRDMRPLIVRSIICEADDRADELYRLLLFYRDRLTATNGEATANGQFVERLLVVGNHFDKNHVSEIVNETLEVNLHALRPEDVGLTLPSGDLNFDHIAAPAGLATLAW